MKTYADKEDDRNFVLRIHCKTWEAAFAGANEALHRPPKGYRVLKATLARNPNRGGRACALTIIFRHMDRRHPRLTDLDLARRACTHIGKVALDPNQEIQARWVDDEEQSWQALEHDQVGGSR